MSKKGVTKYRIQKNGIDICKIVFTKAKDIAGRFDIKITFYNEKYAIKVHKLFCYKSNDLHINNTENKQISYHYGRDGEVKIQLRNIIEKVSPEKIIYNLVPPNDYSIFPIPLFKLEISNNVIEPKVLVDSNKVKHEGIILDLEENNTIEVFMVNPNDKIEDVFNKYEPAFLLEDIAPIEYLASNGGRVGYEKNLFFLNEFGEHILRKEMIAKDLNIMVGGYHNRFFENKNILPTITFIENELYEDIILNTSYNPIITIDGKEKRIPGYINAGKDCFDFNNDNILIKDTIGERICRYLKGKEKEDFFERCIKSRHKLGNKYNKFHDLIKIEKEELEYKVNLFLLTIEKLNRYYIKKYENKELETNISPEILWLINVFVLKSEETNILLGKYLGIDNFKMYKVLISYNGEKEKDNYEMDMDNQSIYIINDLKKVDIYYCYMEYDSIYNIHPLSYYINCLLGENNEIPLICRGEEIFVENNKFNSVRTILKEKQYECSQLEYRTINLEDEFKRVDYLGKVYDIILKEINDNAKVEL